MKFQLKKRYTFMTKSEVPFLTKNNINNPFTPIFALVPIGTNWYKATTIV